MSETLKFQGRLALLEQEKLDVEIRLRGLLYALRDQLDPFAPLADLKGEIIAAQALDLSNTLIELGRKTGEIAAIRRALGR